jgi:hypothetical protein
MDQGVQVYLPFVDTKRFSDAEDGVASDIACLEGGKQGEHCLGVGRQASLTLLKDYRYGSQLSERSSLYADSIQLRCHFLERLMGIGCIRPRKPQRKGVPIE